MLKSTVHQNKTCKKKLIVCSHCNVNNKLCVMPLSTTTYAFTCYAIWLTGNNYIKILKV